MKVMVGTQELRAIVPSTGGAQVFQEVSLGSVDLPEGGIRLSLFPHTLKWGYIFADIEKVVLTPQAVAGSRE